MSDTSAVRYWASTPFMMLSSVLLANAELLARAGDWVAGGYWSETKDRMEA